MHFCFLNSPKELKRIFRQAWGHVVFAEVKHRKCISDHGKNHCLRNKAFQSFPPSEQVILARGEFQSGTAKSFWAEGNDGACPFCGAPHNHAHRLLECMSTSCVRDKHSDTVWCLCNERPEWAWLSLARGHPENEFL